MRPLGNAVRRSLASAAANYTSSLPGSPAAAYLQARGIDPEGSPDAPLLGYVADPAPGHEQYTGRLAVINRCLDGHVVGMKFRAINDTDGVKYLGLTGLEARLYNLHALSLGGTRIHVTEGELDAVLLQQMGFPAVAVPGANTWRTHTWRLLEGYEEVVVVRDNDGPGERLAQQIAATDLPVRVVTPPVGNDVGECVVAGFGADLVRVINGEAAA